MSYVVVDVESDGPIPAEYSMVCFGAVVFDEKLDKSFYGQTHPISDRFVPEALAADFSSAKVLVLLCPSEPMRPQRVVIVLPD